MKAVLLALATVVTLTDAVRLPAAPPDLKQISSEAKWVVYLDADALRASTIVDRAWRAALALHPPAARALADVREKLHFDPAKDVHSITLYGNRLARRSGVALVHADFDQAYLLDKVRYAPDHRTIKHGAYELHAWTDHKGGTREHAVVGAFAKPTVLVLAETEDLVKAALDVLDGRHSRLADKTSPLAAPIPRGTILVARGVGLADAELPYKSPLVRQSQSIDVAVGEDHGESFLEGRFVANSTEVAQQAKSVIEGARAMAALQHGGDALAKKILDALDVAVAENTLTVKWRVSAEDVWTAAQKIARRVAEARAEHKQRERPQEQPHE